MVVVDIQPLEVLNAAEVVYVEQELALCRPPVPQKSELVVLRLRDPDTGDEKRCVTRNEPWLREGSVVYFMGVVSAVQGVAVSDGVSTDLLDLNFAEWVYEEEGGAGVREPRDPSPRSDSAAAARHVRRTGAS